MSRGNHRIVIIPLTTPHTISCSSLARSRFAPCRLSSSLSGEREGKLRLDGVTVCGGNAPLKHAAAGLRMLLAHAGLLDGGDAGGGSELGGAPALGASWRDMRVGWPASVRSAARSRRLLRATC